MEYFEVLKTDQLAEGGLRTVDVKGQSISLTQIGSRYYAFADTCTHERCSLGGGFLEGDVIECPCHGARFDVKTGAVKALPATENLKTYPVKVEKGALFVSLD